MRLGSCFQVDSDNVRPIQEGSADPLLEAEKIAVATKEALKRKIAQSATNEFQSRSLPQKLQIDPNDPEDVVCLLARTLMVIINLLHLLCNNWCSSVLDLIFWAPN